MSEKEATARIKINRLLEAGGWRFFPEGTAPANIRLEPTVAIKSTELDALGNNFEKTARGFVDFLLLDAKGFPFIVLEAKAEDKNPLPEVSRVSNRKTSCWRRSSPSSSLITNRMKPPPFRPSRCTSRPMSPTTTRSASATPSSIYFPYSARREMQDSFQRHPFKTK